MAAAMLTYNDDNAAFLILERPMNSHEIIMRYAKCYVLYNEIALDVCPITCLVYTFTFVAT